MAGEHTSRRRYSPVFGNLAYDLDTLTPEAEEYAPEPAPVRELPQAVRRRSPSVPAGLVIGAVFAGALLVAALLGRVHLTAMNDQAVELTEQVQALETEQAILRIRYEETFNLEEIERVATGELGMQPPRSDPICYVSGQLPDQATVLAAPEENGFLKRITDAVGACFR